MHYCTLSMSSHPILSLKSSVGSKSSSSSSFAYNQPTSSAQLSAECFAYHQENHSPHLHSSWISRLLPTSATTSSGELLHDKLTTSSSNFSIIRRCLGFDSMKPLPISNISPADGDGDGDVGLVASFGPFKVRGNWKSDGGVIEKQKGCVLERSRISRFAVRYGSRLSRGEARVLQGGSSSMLQSCFGPWRVGGGMKTPVYGALVANRGSGLEAPRRRGAAYRDVNDGGSASGSLLDIHNLRDNVMPQQPGIQARKIEAEEPFSFWNMGRVKKANFVSSVSPSFDLSWNFDRKRKLNAEDINCFKYRRM